MNILAIYGTSEGQTEKIARFIAERLRARHHAVDVVNAARPPSGLATDRYDAVIVGAPVRMAKYPRAVIDFVRTSRPRLEQVPSAFFSVCMAVASENDARRREAETWPEGFFKETGWRPRLTATFAGALRYSQYNWLLRWMMKRIARSEGTGTDTSLDHEYTDWEAVSRFADLIGKAVAAKG